MNKTLVLSAALVAVAGLGAGAAYTLLNQGGDRYAGCRATAISGGPGAIGGPFELVSETGETVTDADVITRASLIYFGYTFCPDVCPLDTVRNADAVDLLQEQGYNIQPVFISIDPERDTPEALAYFTDNMHPDMIGLTGSIEQVTAASRAYKTYFRKQDSDDEFYLVDHSTFTYLVFPEDGFVEFFRRDISSEQMAETVSCFLDAAS